MRAFSSYQCLKAPLSVKREGVRWASQTATASEGRAGRGAAGVEAVAVASLECAMCV